jgi:predicted phage terminase large subunit-like protein
MQSDWFVKRWGHRFGWVQRDPADGDYFNTMGGRRFASSVDGKATGKHFHRQVIDDPLKPKGVSPVTLEGTKKWLSGTMATRWARGDIWQARSCVMQRLHEDDTTAQILATDVNAVHLMLPMEYEPARKCVVYIGPNERLTNKETDRVFFEDPRKEEGQLLCPDFMTPEVLTVLKSELTVQEQSAQLQQNPKAKGGNIFKDHEFRFWIHPGAETARFEQAVPPRLFKELPKKFDQQWQSWDFAFKDTKTSDFVCGQVWGRVQADFFLLWQVCDRMDFTASLKAIKVFTGLFPKARKKLVEDKANGTAIMNALKGRMFGIEAIEPEGGKEARASACAPLVESGNVYIPDPDQPGFEWVRPYMNQMTSFPYAKNDDQVDATSQALNWGSSKATRFAAAMERLQGDNPAAAHLKRLIARMGG